VKVGHRQTPYKQQSPSSNGGALLFLAIAFHRLQEKQIATGRWGAGATRKFGLKHTMLLIIWTHSISSIC